MLTFAQQPLSQSRFLDYSRYPNTPDNHIVNIENAGGSQKPWANLQKPNKKIKFASGITKSHINYTPMSNWHLYESVPGQESFNGKRFLRVMLWNIYSKGPDAAKRASWAMDSLREVFGDLPPPMVIMLQGVQSQSLAAILDHQWAMENFALSNVDAPMPSFTLVMVSKDIRVETWFRAAISGIERNALIVSIPIYSLEGESIYRNQRTGQFTIRQRPLPESERGDSVVDRMAQLLGTKDTVHADKKLEKPV